MYSYVSDFMTYGLNIRNRLSALQIDGHNFNYFFKEDGFNVSVDNTGNGGKSTLVNFSRGYFPLEAPLVAYRPVNNNEGIGLWRFAYSGGLITGCYFTCLRGYTHHVDWRLYTHDYSSSEPEDVFGIRIFNDYGKEIFGSHNKAMRFNVGRRYTLNWSDWTTTYTVNHDEVAPFFVLQPQGWAIHTIIPQSPFPATYGRTGLQRITNTQTKVTWIPFYYYSAMGGVVHAGSSPPMFFGIIPAT